MAIDQSYLSLGSLFIAALALVVSPAIASYAAKRTMVGAMREKWNSNLRQAVSEFCSDLHVLKDIDREKIDDKDRGVIRRNLITRIRTNSYKIKMLLNPKQPDHITLKKSIDEGVNKVNSYRTDIDKLDDLFESISLQTSQILKCEWDRISK